MCMCLCVWVCAPLRQEPSLYNLFLKERYRASACERERERERFEISEDAPEFRKCTEDTEKPVNTYSYLTRREQIQECTLFFILNI